MPPRRRASFDTFRDKKPTPTSPDLYWIDQYGEEHFAPARKDIAAFPFETARQCRRGAKYRDQKNSQGWGLVTQIDAQVWCESIEEQNALILVDHGFRVAAISSQPFCIVFADGRRHIPDFFLRLTNGARVVYDVKPPERLTEEDRAIFDATRMLCAKIGWSFIETEPYDEQINFLVYFLSNYRTHENAAPPEHIELVHDALSWPISLALLLTRVGESVPIHEIYWMMWKRFVGVDLLNEIRLHSEVRWLGNDAN
jgi:hypothetical protein